MNKIETYSKEFPYELKEILKTAPQDDIDWALVMYLFRHSNVEVGCLFKERNVITIRKVANFFNLEYDDVYKRLNKMLWWVSVSTVYGYCKPFTICSITPMGVSTMFGMMDSIKIKDRDTK